MKSLFCLHPHMLQFGAVSLVQSLGLVAVLCSLGVVLAEASCSE